MNSNDDDVGAQHFDEEGRTNVFRGDLLRKMRSYVGDTPKNFPRNNFHFFHFSQNIYFYLKAVTFIHRISFIWKLL